MITHHYQIIEGDNPAKYLLTPKGERYWFKSCLEGRLANTLEDRTFAQAINNAYEQFIFPHCDEELHEHWLRYLETYCPLFGPDAESMYSLFSGLINTKIRLFFDQYPDACRSFFGSIAEGQMNDRTDTTQTSQDHIVILTASQGSGHNIAAEAIKGLLTRMGFEVSVLNTDEIGKETDPLTLCEVRYKGDPISIPEIYTRIIQQDGNAEAWLQMDEIKKEILSYLSIDHMESVLTQIKKLKPKLILSTATYKFVHASVASRLQIPLRFIATDYDVNRALIPILLKANKELIQLWIASDEPEILQPTIGNLSFLEWYLGSEAPEVGFEESLRLLKKQGVIQVCGFPIRAHFKRELNPDAIATLKRDRDISSDRTVVLLTMGMHGDASEIREGISLLLASETELPRLELVVICGKNQPLKQELEQDVPVQSDETRVRVRIEGFLSEKEMANYYKMAHVILTKTGGVTCAEAEQMATFMLILPGKLYGWETPNMQYMERKNLVKRRPQEISLADCLQELLNRRRDEIAEPIDWETRFTELLTSDFG